MPLLQCKQKYDSMDLEFRKNVLNWIEDLIEKYELGILQLIIIFSIINKSINLFFIQFRKYNW